METQNNTYLVYDSMGRPTDIYILASNINEARKIAIEKRKAGEINTDWYIVKRCYSGGVRGSQLS